MNEARKLYEHYAQFAEKYDRNSRDPELITFWADRYCKAYDEGNEEEKMYYISALMCKFWDNVGRMYDTVKTANTHDYDDCASKLYECIQVACNYRAWQKPDAKTTAKACINQAISSRGAAEIMYNANRECSKVNCGGNYVSIDQTMGSDEDSDTLGDLIEDAYESPVALDSSLNAKGLIQSCIDSHKLVEAVVLDTILNYDCVKTVKEKEEYVDDLGETKTKMTEKSEFSRYKTVQSLNELNDVDERRFLGSYSVAGDALRAVMAQIKAVPNTKLYKYVDSATNMINMAHNSGRI